MEINVKVENKIATLVNKEQFIVCGNNDYKVHFEFDEEWDKYVVKTALFVFGEDTVPVVFEGDVCDGVEISGALKCGIGCFAGDIRTTTPAFIDCLASVRDLGGVPKEPTPEVYDQIMELLNRYINSIKGAPSGGKKGQVLKKKSDLDYDYEWQDDEMRDLTNYYTKEEIPTVVGKEIEKYFEENPPKEGVSPTISVTPIENGHRVTITDVNGKTSFDVMNGDPYTLTESDKSEIVQDVLAALPKAEAVKF